MKNKSSKWVIGGAALTAALSSACCWLPLLLLAFGTSAAGIGGVFETYRPYLLGATVLLLGGAFYAVYFRKRICREGDGCSTPNPKVNRLTKTLLWITTVFVLAFAFFPNYIGKLLSSQGAPSMSIDTAGLIEFVVKIEGMTCETCSLQTQTNLSAIPGARSAIVSYKDGSATIVGDSRLNESTIRQAIEAAGYKARSIVSPQ